MGVLRYSIVFAVVWLAASVAIADDGGAPASSSGRGVKQSVEQTRDAERATSGKMVGIGVKLAAHPDGLLIDEVLPGTPAEKSGLKKGEMIVSVDDVPTKDMPITDAVKRITGQEGTVVVLEIQAASGERRKVEITRGTIKLASIQVRILDGRLGYLWINTFSAETGPDVKEAFTKKLDSSVADGIVLDLRGCVGGLYAEVVRVAAMLVDGETPKVLWLVRQKDKEPVPALANSPALTSLPLAVMIDAKTSGAPELLAEALREHGRATLVGATTAGQAAVNQRIKNSDGTSNVVRIGDFVFPSTGKTGTQGVVPDVAAPRDASPEQVLELAKRTLRALIAK